jgi:TetR/AcrR family transcriptional repressor of mexJK operon
MLGTIEPRKNHALLLDVWRTLVARHGDRTPRLVVIGQRGWACEEVWNALDRELALKPYIVERASCSDAELAAYLRRAHAAGTLKVRNPRQAADLFFSMFLGSGHIRGLLKLEMPEPAEDKALLREAVRVFIAAYGA